MKSVDVLEDFYNYSQVKIKLQYTMGSSWILTWLKVLNLATFRLYCNSEGSFTPAGNTSSGHARGAMAVFGDEVILAGGRLENNAQSDVVESLNWKIKPLVWVTLDPLPKPWSGMFSNWLRFLYST